MALFCQIIIYVVKTNLWYRHLVEALRPKLDISKFVHFAENFQKMIISTLKLNFFFKFLAFFQSILVVSFLLIQYNRQKLVELQKFYRATSLQYWQFRDNRLVIKTCNLWEQDETWNLQDRDSQMWSRDKVSRLHHWK